MLRDRTIGVNHSFDSEIFRLLVIDFNSCQHLIHLPFLVYLAALFLSQATRAHTRTIRVHLTFYSVFLKLEPVSPNNLCQFRASTMDQPVSHC